MHKSLKDISWQVTEPEYRDDSVLSYSTLARFEREGFEHLDTLFEKIETPSLLFGSCVDTILTDGDEAFMEQFFIGDLPSMKPSAEPVVKKLFELFHDSYTNINDIPNSAVLPVVKEYNYEARWKDDTRCNSVKQEGFKYYQTMYMAGDKRLVTQDMYNKVFACVRALKDYPQTSKYFMPDDPFSDVKRFYQLKFKDTLNGIEYRCMPDLIVVDYKHKVVIPCDLKTSSNKEYAFPKSFVHWRYDIQARLYWRLIRKAMDKDEYFKDFTLKDYRFIIVSSSGSPMPLIWEFGETTAKGTVEVAGIKLRDPEEIGEELHSYLVNPQVVPRDIKVFVPNSIEKWLIENN